ncbi:hypothetical protein Kpol_480p11 [Vanderwaltozyma polyspora DSM 70294]|uniref:WW domain-containing protein n=1 Tax=Vanderwaltozyma polyspora (strain ATCC 22028 / DSM 70294 / BCRC 21397 / CBS 2163 / NBRC 10782 / NRRL Y-8283 / UCD 57-17) TaxID=436907 RepID=A7TP73_VANPO|nr:uncharacterized protein Kpol_480p11 [Vanderwaltozyma polyspora DSM 70294]EDO15924.1 hypothetical protein Kpol_480p11 [Vanderwaltozyma polyspora DSM 70294]
MPVKIWKEFNAPDGRKYYYNIKSKESTWTKPDSLYDTEKGKVGSDRAGAPLFVFPLLNGWHLIICVGGEKYYYNKVLNDTISKELSDDSSLQLLNAVDKDKLILLIAVARGYNWPDYEKLYDELLKEFELISNDMMQTQQAEVTSTEDEDEDEDENQEGNVVAVSNTGLIGGYLSSDDEESSDENQVEVSENTNIEEDLAKRSDQNDVDENLNSIDHGLDSLDDIDLEKSKSLFTRLFEEFQLDPYSSWRLQLKKIQNHPDYFQITDNSTREELFESWCSSKFNGGKSNVTNFEGEDEETLTSDEEDDFEPTKFHYLAHIISKADIAADTIFLDIKENNKSLFKEFKIKDFIKSKKDQEAFSSKLLFFYKKFQLNERKNLFLQLLKENENLIIPNINSNIEIVRHIIKNDVDEAYEIETQLLQIEKIIGLQNMLVDLANDPKYYILGIKDKLILLKEYLKDKI